VAIISGENAIAVRLLSLSDGRLLWSKSLREGGLKQKDELVGRVCDLVFTTDQHSDHDNFPDLIVLNHQSHAFRLSGHEGVVRWTWKTVDPTWYI
jgi:hypothetical protein